MAGRLWAVLGVFLLGLSLAAPALAHGELVRVGVLSFRSLEQTQARWEPLGRYLEQHVPGYRFKIVPLYYPDLDAAVDNHQVDFILTNPEHYVLLRSRQGMAAFVTFIPLAEGHPVTEFGGVIATLASRDDIKDLSDLSGRQVAAPSPESFGGNMMQLWEFHRRKLAPPHVTYLGMPHDKSIVALLAGKADAAFVRTGVLEAMAAKGQVDLARIKLINRQPAGLFPQIRSTDLYPEWPMAAMKGEPEELVKAVGLALLQMSPQEAQACELYGFAPPADYAPVEAIMLRLRQHPGRIEHFDLWDVVDKYQRPFLAALTTLFLAALALVVYLVRVNRRLAATYAVERRMAGELSAANRDLRRFSELVAHHLSEPARVMSIQADWLGRDVAPDERERAMALIRSEGRRLLALLRGFERYMSLGGLPRGGHCSVAAELDAVVARLDHCGALGRAEVVREQLGEVALSSERLYLILDALLDNALRFAHPARPARIEVGLENRGDHQVLYVRDNGIGIDPQYQARIFEVFERLNASRSDDRIGLGLAVARRCIEDVGGSLTLTSVPGQGCEFCLHLPRQAA